jgi:hypothetical protein
MTRRREPFLAWPCWGYLGYALRLAAALAVWWVIVYYGADYWTGLRARRVRIHFDAELAIPFVPAFIIAYLSLHLVFVLAPFVLRRRRDLQALALAWASVTAVAGIGLGSASSWSPRSRLTRAGMPAPGPACSTSRG